MSSIGRRKAKYESCPRLLLEQAVALRHTARYVEFLRLFEPSHHNHPRPNTIISLAHTCLNQHMHRLLLACNHHSSLSKTDEHDAHAPPGV